jgi:WW domain-containing oxidoreductase
VTAKIDRLADNVHGYDGINQYLGTIEWQLYCAQETRGLSQAIVFCKLPPMSSHPETVFAKRGHPMSRIKPLARATADEVLAGIDLYRKRMVVTGCHTDIGFETMKSLAANGAQVIGLARTIEEARAACDAVGRSCTPVGCDLTNLHSIDAAVSLIRRDGGPLDAVVTNLESDTQPAAHGMFEYIGAFALLNRLSDLLRRNSGRIVMAATAAAGVRRATRKRKEHKYDGKRCSRTFDAAALYIQSTMAIRLYAKEFARRLALRGIAANAVDVGVAHALLEPSRNPWHSRRWYSLSRLFTRSAARGAATVVLLAASPQVARMSGEFWIEGKVAESGSLPGDEALARRLWEASEKMVAGCSGDEHAEVA